YLYSLVQRANQLLEQLEIKANPFRAFEDLQESASSMFVAMGWRTIGELEGVTRPPVVDHVRNAQIVINALTDELGGELPATGAGIVDGDPYEIEAVLGAFEELLWERDVELSQRVPGILSSSSAGLASGEARRGLRQREFEELSAEYEEGEEEYGSAFP